MSDRLAPNVWLQAIWHIVFILLLNLGNFCLTHLLKHPLHQRDRSHPDDDNRNDVQQQPGTHHVFHADIAAGEYDGVGRCSNREHEADACRQRDR